MSDIKDAIKEITKEKAQQILKWLIETPSISGYEGEGKLGLKIHKELTSMGIPADLYEVDSKRYNVIATLGNNGSKSLMVHVHIDTVDIYDFEEPFKTKITDGKIYGRGAADIKGGAAAMLLAADVLKEIGNIDKKLIFAFVVDEETHARGTLDLLSRGIKTDCAIVLEPTKLHVCTSHATCMKFHLTVKGLSAHGATPREGVNAIDLMYSLISELKGLSFLNEKGDLDMMEPAMTVGEIKGGITPWVVPHECEAQILFHVFPEHQCDMIIEQVKDLVDNFSKKYQTKVFFKALHGSNGYTIPEDDRLVQLLQNNVKRTTEDKRFAFMPSETDAIVLQHKGGIPSVVFGPGDLRCAHSNREYVEIEEVVNAAKIICLTVNDY